METLQNTQYAAMRGFNYLPSNITYLRDVTEMFDRQIWEKELDIAKKHGSKHPACLV